MIVLYWLLVISLLVFSVVESTGQLFDIGNRFEDFLILDSKYVSEQCRSDSVAYRRELEKHTEWAVQMYDASVKRPYGVLYGANHHFGNFDQCLDVLAASKDKAQKIKFQGKYCLSTVIFRTPRNITSEDVVWHKISEYAKDDRRFPRNKVRWAFCIPSSCATNDLTKHLKHTWKDLNVEVSLDDKNCQIKEEMEYSTLDKVMVYLSWSIFTIVLSCTIYELNTTKDDHPNSKLHQLVVAFSFVTNTARLFATKEDEHKLRVVHGLRFWGMVFTIMAHQFMYAAPPLNGQTIENFYQNKMGAAWLNGPILIDVFFVLTGFLSVYFLLDELQTKKRLNYVVVCLHRVYRMVPLYAYVILFYCTFFIRFGSGPLWKEKISEQQDHCVKNWWLNLLYINNYFDLDHLCMDQSWYIAANMQLFFLSPLIVYNLHKNPEKIIKILMCLIGVAVVISFLQIYITGLDPVVLVYKILGKVCKEKTFQIIYAPTHHRLSPYLIGVIGGYYKYKFNKENVRISRSYTGIGWIFVCLSMLGGMYLGHIFYQGTRQYYHLEAALFGSLHHVFIALSILWFIFAVSDNKGIYIGIFLDPWIFTPLSRLTYAVYLCHLILQMGIQNSVKASNYTSIPNFLCQFMGDLFWIYFFGFILSMFVETPINNLENLFNGKGIKSYMIERRKKRKLAKTKQT